MKLRLLQPIALCFTCASLILAGCSTHPAPPATPTAQSPSDASGIAADKLLAHIKVLSSDEFEGRAPGSHGEQLSVDYLVGQFKALGLQPGNPDGTYVQDVPLLGTQSRPKVTFNTTNGPISPSIPDDAVIWSRREGRQFAANDSPLVFVGYGVVAPEYSWDDYKDISMAGKTAIILINDPPVPDPNDPAKLDTNMFKGKAMTYYGRWTYKYETAAAKGAAAAIIVHQTGPAGYPWAVVTNSNGRENFDLQDSSERLVAQGWMTLDFARKLFTASGKDFDALQQAALKPGFRPVLLGNRATISVGNIQRRINSHNVIAKIEGTDPKLKDEYIIYTAHWDHLGRDRTLTGDQIYNGAVDNASGCATVLELARAFSQHKPKRSVLFLIVTAEEKGLLGSRYYATHPLYPLDHTLANINIDGINVWGRTHDVCVVGLGQSTLEDTLNGFVAAQHRLLIPEPEPEKGFFFRSDHFEFAKQGVPALYVHAGLDYVGKPPGYGKEKFDEYVAHDYHKPSDEIKPGWDLSGAVEDINLLYEVGQKITNQDAWSEWKPGSEFKARRDEMLKKK